MKDKQKGKKDEDIPTSEKDELNDLDKKWDDLKSKKEAIFVGFSSRARIIPMCVNPLAPPPLNTRPTFWA